MTNFFIDPSASPQSSKPDLLATLVQQGWIGQHEAEVLSKLPLEEINRRMRIIAKR